MTQALDSAHARQTPSMLDSELQDSDNTFTYDTPLAIARVLDEACAKRASLTLRLETASHVHLFHSRIQGVDLYVDGELQGSAPVTGTNATTFFMASPVLVSSMSFDIEQQE